MLVNLFPPRSLTCCSCSAAALLCCAEAKAPKADKPKKRKDPNAPKGALTAYILFRSEHEETARRRAFAAAAPSLFEFAFPARACCKHARTTMNNTRWSRAARASLKANRMTIASAAIVSDFVSTPSLHSALPPSVLSNAKRDLVKKENPDIQFGQVGRWTAQTATRNN